LVEGGAHGVQVGDLAVEFGDLLGGEVSGGVAAVRAAVGELEQGLDLGEGEAQLLLSALEMPTLAYLTRSRPTHTIRQQTLRRNRASSFHVVAGLGHLFPMIPLAWALRTGVTTCWSPAPATSSSAPRKLGCPRWRPRRGWT